MKRSTRVYVSVLLAMLLGVIALRVYALPANEVETIYFNADGEEVGYSFLGCDGTFFRQGTSTRYKAVTTNPCYDVPTPPEQPAGMCYYNLNTGESGCCTLLLGDCPTNLQGLIITSTTP